MSRASDRLREFHETFDVERPTGEKDSIKRAAKRREKLHVEEHVELEAALDPMIRFGAPAGRKLARELADVIVIAYGTADLFGIDLDAAFEAVMDANMAKLPECAFCDGSGFSGKALVKVGVQTRLHCPACLGTGKGPPIKRRDGKVLKPEGWREPDMSVALREVDPMPDEREAVEVLRQIIRGRDRGQDCMCVPADRSFNGEDMKCAMHWDIERADVLLDSLVPKSSREAAEAELEHLRTGLRERGFTVGRNPDGVDDTVASALLIVDDFKAEVERQREAIAKVCNEVVAEWGIGPSADFVLSRLIPLAERGAALFPREDA